jgi:hypothetical protein
MAALRKALEASRDPSDFKTAPGSDPFPLPAVMLQGLHWALNGEFVANPIRFFNGIYLMFLIWYVAFGAVLGGLFAIAYPNRVRFSRGHSV